MELEVITSPKLAPPVGDYSRAIRAGSLLFVSGHAALDARGEVVGIGDPEVQTRQILENLKTILEAAGTSFQNVVRMNVYLTRIEDRVAVSKVRREYMAPPFPTSTLVQVAALARPEFLVEIEITAILDG